MFPPFKGRAHRHPLDQDSSGHAAVREEHERTLNLAGIRWAQGGQLS